MLNFPEYFNDLSKLVSRNSVLGEQTDERPFGTQTFLALTDFLDIANRMGMQTVNYNGYAGEVILGDGEEIGIIGHLDIVPAGEGWETNPFTLTEKNGYICGRGVLDDKGPLLLCLYALNELKNSGVKINRKFRLIVGCNEETGWKDLEYLNKVTTLPEYGFSPDGNFPVSYAEKGISIFNFYIPKPNNAKRFRGGTAINAVCAKAQCQLIGEPNQEKISALSLLYENGNLIGTGVAAHGSTPQLGKNAILPLLQYFNSSPEIANAVDCLFLDKFGLFGMQNEQGRVTISPNLIDSDQEFIKLSCDCRIPAPFTLNDVIKVVDKFGISYDVTEKHPPVMVEKQGFLVNALINAYNEVTGECGQPESMGGSTFARAFKKGCAFGPEFPNIDGRIHQANERVKKENLFTAYEIYRAAIFSLAEK